MLAAIGLFLAFAYAPQHTAVLPGNPTPSADAAERAQDATEIARGRRPPVLLYSVDPEFTEAARRRGFRGDVLVNLIVDENGKPQDLRVTKGAGMGLDEKAVEAVRQYRFRPATIEGKPVPMRLTIAVNFQVF